MSAAYLAFLIAVLFAAHALRQRWEARGYCCPSCGTRRPREHAAHCAWKRYYESED